MLTALQGQIERIIYTNEENGFTIAKVKVPGRQSNCVQVQLSFHMLPGGA
jgi:exodeoxyribonuclease V alpha subunit